MSVHNDMKELVREARGAGLALVVDGSTLRVTGPRSAASIAKQLLSDKPAVLAALTRERWTADPSPDLAEDSAAWARLLTVAYDQDGGDQAGLFGALHGIRCLGARLSRSSGRWRLGGGVMGEAEYQAARQRYLWDHTTRLAALLGMIDGELRA